MFVLPPPHQCHRISLARCLRYGMGVLLLIQAGLASSETLTLVNWEEYLDPEVVEEWEARSGHQLRQVFFDNDEARDSLILSQRDQSIDIAVIDETTARQFAEKGLFTHLQAQPKLADLPLFDKQHEAMCGAAALPYLWGTLGVVYRTDKFETPPTSWQVLFDPPTFARGHIGLIDDFTDTLAPALMMLGHSINTDQPEELKAAFESTKSALPHVLTFTYNISYADLTPQREQLYLALAYSGDQYTLNEKYGNEIWEYTTLQEGTIVWTDCLAVLASSPRKEIALDFLRYISLPSVAARNSEAVYVASPIPAARALQSEDIRADSTVYPAIEQMNSHRYGLL